MPKTKVPPPVEYDKDRTYTLKEFESLNNWLKTNELVIDKTPINHFELSSEGKLIPMPQTPIFKELVVAEISRQVSNWNINSRINGAVTCSQGGFNLSTTGGRTIRTPDVAFTPSETYRDLTPQQLLTFQGENFHPTFVAEVENVSTETKLRALTSKFKNEYFPAGIQLGWLVDPENKKIYVFTENRRGVRRSDHGWSDVSGGDILRGFVLNIWDIEEAISQEPSESSESEEDDLELECPECDLVFADRPSFLEHYQREHARKRRRRD